MRPVVAGVPVALLGGALAVSEWLHWRASSRGLGDPGLEPGREAILVPGYRNRGTRANSISRYRVRVALRSVDARATETVLIFCGGRVGGEVPEAELLLRHARDDLGYSGPYLLESISTTTWENVENTVGLLEEFDTVKIASNSLHAERARTFLWQQRPDIARRLVHAQDYRFGETPLAKPAAIIYGLWREHSLKRSAGAARAAERHTFWQHHSA
jgi:hypothetical protein